jgi:hypothetical protein
VLACLPDGSRALIPAQWTDWDEGHCGGVRTCREANVGLRALGKPCAYGAFLAMGAECVGQFTVYKKG